MPHIVASLRRLLVALLLGLPVGFLLGIAASFGAVPRRTVSLITSVLLPLPGMALIPVAVILFGFGDMPIIVVATIGALAPMIYSVMAGIEAFPSEVLEAACMDGCSRFSSLFRIQIPMIRQSIETGARLGLVKCWRTVIATEFVAAASAGLGYSIRDAAEYLRFDLIIFSVAALSVVCKVLDGLVVFAFRE